MKDLLLSPQVLVFVATGLFYGGVRLSRWLKERGRREVIHEVNESFVYDMATNHLPHLYDGMRLIAEKLDVQLPDPPPIRFVPFDPKETKERERRD